MKRKSARAPKAINFAREQRRLSNDFAETVWQWIRNRKIDNAKFRREVPIPPYTVDFCCVDLKLIIEIDGQHHFTEEGLGHDQARDRFLENLGYKILRIPGYEVLRDDGAVITRIRNLVRQALEIPSPSPPTPLPFVPQGRGEKELSRKVNESWVGDLVGWC